MLNIPFCPTVPGIVIIAAILIVFKISFIVLIVIRIEIPQCKAIMAGDKINAVVGFSPIILVKVC